jgi:hypothetical protein
MSAKAILPIIVASTLTYLIQPALTAADAKPLKVLLIAGGCCHDYANQKGVLKKGIEARANAEVDIIFVADGSTRPKLPIYGNPDYAKGYDLVIHDECASDVNDPAVVEGVLLDRSVVGENASVRGAAQRINIGESSEVEIT